MLLNVNIGILGHVDSGKTTLSRVLSTTASTAAFDKNPQSQRRGITLDLGFSSLKVDTNIPLHLAPADAIQLTFVDCPGHASLIRTIICGAHIIDLMLLVVDVNKGFQTQTAECLVIGELCCDALVVVLNKVDLISVEKRSEKIAKLKSRVAKTLESTKFRGAPIVPFSAIQNDDSAIEGSQDLISTLLNSITDPLYKRRELANLPFLFAVDHCFAIPGQGTIFTGTVLRGQIRVGEIVEIPKHKLKKKIKSMQVFRRPVEEASPGDRVGICVTQVDSNVMERGFLSAPNSLLTCQACLLTEVMRISYFKGNVRSKQRFHVSIGQDTILARITCLRRVEIAGVEEFEYVDELCDGEEGEAREMVLDFDTSIVAPMGSLVIGSRLDTDPLAPTCRLAFHGVVARVYTSTEECRASLSVYRHKHRLGEVERVVDPRNCIVRDLFKRETNWDLFRGFAVTVATRGEENAVSIPAMVEGSFGLSGRCRIRLSSDLPEVIVKRFSGKAGKKSAKVTSTTENPIEDTATNKLRQPPVVTLNFKKYLFGSTKPLVQ